MTRRSPFHSSDNAESQVLAEARALLGRCAAEIGAGEGLAHLSLGLSLLADVVAAPASATEHHAAFDLARTCMKIIQAHIDSRFSRDPPSSDPPVRVENLEEWLNMLWEFEAFGFALPPDVAETRSRLQAEKVQREIALMSPAERKELLARLQAIDIDGGSDD